MISLERAKWTLLGLISLSLLFKIVTTRPSPVADPMVAAAALEQLLRKAGYDATIIRLGRSPRIVVSGHRGGCRMMAGDYLPHGTFADAYASLAQTVGPLSYAYRGRLYQRPPRIGLFDFYLWRELRRIGIDRGRPAIFAVAATSACRIEDIGWQEVATVKA